MATSTTTTTLGRRFAEAPAARDRDALAALLHPHVDFRGMTPSRVWQAADPAAVLEIEQQAYLSERDARIGRTRVVCSGFRRPS
jgi:hypothetical protein